jgi:hypothetical protein
MPIAELVKETKNGLFISREAYANFGEIEIMRTDNSIIIRPRTQSPQGIIQILQQTDLLMDQRDLPVPEAVVTQDDRVKLAKRFSNGRPLSEIIIENRDEG